MRRILLLGVVAFGCGNLKNDRNHSNLVEEDSVFDLGSEQFDPATIKDLQDVDPIPFIKLCKDPDLEIAQRITVDYLKNLVPSKTCAELSNYHLVLLNSRTIQYYRYLDLVTELVRSTPLESSVLSLLFGTTDPGPFALGYRAPYMNYARLSGCTHGNSGSCNEAAVRRVARDFCHRNGFSSAKSYRISFSEKITQYVRCNYSTPGIAPKYSCINETKNKNNHTIPQFSEIICH